MVIPSYEQPRPACVSLISFYLLFGGGVDFPLLLLAEYGHDFRRFRILGMFFESMCHGLDARMVLAAGTVLVSLMLPIVYAIAGFSVRRYPGAWRKVVCIAASCWIVSCLLHAGTACLVLSYSPTWATNSANAWILRSAASCILPVFVIWFVVRVGRLPLACTTLVAGWLVITGIDTSVFGISESIQELTTTYTSSAVHTRNSAVALMSMGLSLLYIPTGLLLRRNPLQSEVVARYALALAVLIFFVRAAEADDPGAVSPPSYGFIGFANWAIPLLAPIVLMATLKRYVRRNSAVFFSSDHLCSSCGYDLTGNVSGRCPECGQELSGDAAETGLDAREESRVSDY